MSLRHTALSAGRWTLFSTLLRAALLVAQTMLLARLLEPADFGLMAIAGGVIAVTSVVSNLGVNSALIHFPLPSAHVLSTLYWLNIIVAVILAITLSLSAVLISWVYGQPALAPLLIAASAVFPLAALGQQFMVLSEKNLRFSDLAKIEALAALGGFATAVTFASVGAGAYTFVASALVAGLVTSVLARSWLAHDFRPIRHFSLQEALPFVRFGAFQLGDTICNSLRMQADIFVGGYFFPAPVMGFYSTTRDLSMRIAGTLVNPAVTRVGLPVMAIIQGNRHALKEVYLQTLQLTASLNFPIYALLYVYADETIEIVLGAQWAGAGLYLRIFSLWGCLRATGNPVGSLLYATGLVRLSFAWNLILLLVVPWLLWLAAQLDELQGLAWAMVGIQALVFVPAWRVLVVPACGATFVEYIGQLVPPLLATAAAVPISIIVGTQFDAALARLVFGGVTLAVVYTVVSYWVNRGWLSTTAELVRPIWMRWR